MATVRLKYRTSSVADRDGTLYYQVIHCRIARQIPTGYRIKAYEWDSRKAIVTSSSTNPERAAYLVGVNKRVTEDIARIESIIAWFERHGNPYSAAGIEQNVSFHTAMHLMATLSLADGGDLYTVDNLLGHTSINSTQIYPNVVMETKIEAVKRISDFFSN